MKKQPKYVGLTLQGLQKEIKLFNNETGDGTGADSDDQDSSNKGNDDYSVIIHSRIIGSGNKLKDQLFSLDEAVLKAQEDQEDLNIDEVLADFEWKAGADASALESRLQNELSALESVSVLYLR